MKQNKQDSMKLHQENGRVIRDKHRIPIVLKKSYGLCCHPNEIIFSVMGRLGIGPSFALVELFGIHMRTMELEVFHNWLDLVSICSKVAKAMSLNTGVKCLMGDPLCGTWLHHY